MTGPDVAFTLVVVALIVYMAWALVAPEDLQ